MSAPSPVSPPVKSSLSGYPHVISLDASLAGASGALQLNQGANSVATVDPEPDHNPAISGDAMTRIRNNEQAGYDKFNKLER